MQRLAIVYAPAAARSDWLTLLALDARLAGVVRTAREPMIAQLKLAWWRDRLSADPAGWPKGEPLLARLAEWGGTARELVALVDGWEALLGELPLEQAAVEEFVAGRETALRALAGRIGAGGDLALASQVRRWALADLAQHAPDVETHALARQLLADSGKVARISKPLRPLAVLGGLSARALRRSSAEALDGPGALGAAIRLGFTGG